MVGLQNSDKLGGMFGGMRARTFLLGGIIGLAIVLRFVGIKPGYPAIHADEGASHSQAIQMILERTLVPKKGVSDPFVYGLVMPLVNAVFFLVIFIPGGFLINLGKMVTMIRARGWGEFLQVGLYQVFDNDILGVNKINVVYWSRYITAGFGVGVVFMSYLLARRLFKSERTGLIAGYLVAINYRQVLNGHLGLPDVYNAFFLILAMYWVVGLWDEPTKRNCILAGVGAATYFSVKLQIWIVGPLVWVLVNEKKRILKREIWWMISVAIVGGLLWSVVHILNWREAVEELRYVSLKYQAGRNRFDWYSYWYLSQIGLGRVGLLLVVGGIGIGLIKKFKQTMLLLSVIVPFMGFLTYYTAGGFYTRNLVTITPLLLVFVAYGVEEMIGRVKKPVNLLAGGLLLGIISFESLGNAIIVPREYLRPWNRKMVEDWVGENINKEEKVAKRRSDYYLAELQEDGVGWAVVNMSEISGNYYWWMGGSYLEPGKRWQRPDEILVNTPIAKMMMELKNYVVFEELNSWQAPDENFVVVKVPGKLNINNEKQVYREDFDLGKSWGAENDGYGEVKNLKWDENGGIEESGALEIAGVNGGFYSQRLVSDTIAVGEGGVVKVRGNLKASKMLKHEERDGLLGVDFWNGEGRYLTSALAGRIWGSENWTEREIAVMVPEGAKIMKVYFQAGFNGVSFWLDEVEVWKGEARREEEDENKFVSRYDPREHLFPYSHGGM